LKDRKPRQTAQPKAIAGRVPPHDLDAEAAVLSAILLERDALDLVIDLLKREHFYSDANARIYEATTTLVADNKPIDIVTVASWLRDREWLAQIGGASYLAQLADATPAVAHVGAHARVVYEKWRLRQLIATCQRVAAEGYGDVGTVQEFIDGAEQSIYALARDDNSSGATLEQMQPIVTKVFDEIREAAERGQTITGIPTGFDRFDQKIAGLHDGELMIIAGRPGMGKSAYVMNVAVNVAAPAIIQSQSNVCQYGVAVFSLEMPKEQLSKRMICSEGKVNLGKMRNGNLYEEDWRRITEAGTFVASLPIWIDDTPAISLLALRAKVRRKQAEFNRKDKDGKYTRRVGLVVIDYLQLMRGREGVQNREQEISELSRGLKELAKELKVPVIALSQLSREVEKRGKDKRPQLSDLRECIAGDQLVYDAANDDFIAMRDIVARGLRPVVAGVDGSESLCYTQLADAWSTGVKPVFKVTTSGGRTLRCTSNHPLLSARGWRRVDQLEPGSRVAVFDGMAPHEHNLMIGAEITWDEIVRIEPDGEEECFDVRVPATANFVVNGFVAHNSGAIEQDADTIVFIFRDEYYQKEASSLKGIAELIIAKQRNGETGKLLVKFDGAYTRFDNLAPHEYPTGQDE
jgi:replicative DNA helicase